MTSLEKLILSAGLLVGFLAGLIVGDRTAARKQHTFYPRLTILTLQSYSFGGYVAAKFGLDFQEYWQPLSNRLAEIGHK